MKKKILIYSDTHLNFTLPWTQYNFVSTLKQENPDAIILTGDIACGLTIEYFLAFLEKQLKIPIYFILGNHDFYASSFNKIETSLSKLCDKHHNLHWMNKIDFLSLKDDIGIVGHDGWYDGRIGNPIYLGYNLDWIMVEEFRKLKSFEEKFEFGQALSDKSTEALKCKLEIALTKFKTVYILTHVPPWQGTTRGVGSGIEEFWIPYNVNIGMGKMLEELMETHKDKNIIIIAGHTHSPAIIHVSHNIECMIMPGKYLGSPNEHNSLFI